MFLATLQKTLAAFSIWSAGGGVAAGL